MGKTYIDTVKYVVYATVEIGGLIEKPDVVGAIFGQTEGLLGDELDLRELQKNGRVGRIEVDLQNKGGKTFGKITLPSSLDMVETSILAAALETVDRVGPCDAAIHVEKIEDTRNVKRKQVVDRAKGLLKKLLTTEIPESKEISELVRAEVKIAEIAEYGPEKLPAGPNVQTQNSIIIVEGRADVINLLKNDINNVVAVGGANVPRTIADLCREKEVTVFLDGDRGGDIILRELSQTCDIDFVARAPRGKEVEELTRKEMIKCIRSRIPSDQIEGLSRRSEDNRAAEAEKNNPSEERKPKFGFFKQQQNYSQQSYQSAPNFQQPAQSYQQPAYTQPAPVARAPEPAQHAEAHVEEPKREVRIDIPGMPGEFARPLGELENTLKARLFGDGMVLKGEVPVRDLIRAMTETEAVTSVVLDGIVTQRLVDLAETKGIKILVGVKLGNLIKKPEVVVIYTKSN